MIIAAVMSFGAALAHLRGARTGKQIAAAALGPNSTDLARRDFANYLSKIEHDKVPGVGLDRLRLIAKGLGFTVLTDFFQQIEAAQIKTPAEPDSTLKMPDLRATTPLSKTPLVGEARDQAAALSAVAALCTPDDLESLAARLATAAARLRTARESMSDSRPSRPRAAHQSPEHRPKDGGRRRAR